MKISLAAASTLLMLSALTACGDDSEAADAAPAVACDSALTLVDKESGTETNLTNFGAVSLINGAAYTVYAGDFDLDMPNVSMFSNPEVPADGNLVTVSLTVFNAETEPDPIEVGAVVPASSEFGKLVFVVTHTAGETLRGNNTGSTGETTVRAVGENLCIDVEYSDDEKAISGTIGTEVKALS